MEILHKFHNALLSRTELQLDLPYQNATPSTAEVKKMVADKLKASEDLVVIKKIANIFGTKKALVAAYIYDSKESFDKFEPKPKAKKAQEVTASPAPAAAA